MRVDSKEINRVARDEGASGSGGTQDSTEAGIVEPSKNAIVKAKHTPVIKAKDGLRQRASLRRNSTSSNTGNHGARRYPKGSRQQSHHGSTSSSSSSSHARAFVEHHYHDHARDPIATTLPGTMIGGHRTPAGDGVMTRSFPEKLHHLLDAMDREGTEGIVSWQPHGRCFAIHDKVRFVNEVMSRFFLQTKLTSFQRQLNLYGFIRLTTGRDRGGYYHEYFLRGRPDLCQFMVRTRVKGVGMKAASSPATEPDLYSYETCPVMGPSSIPSSSSSSLSSLPWTPGVPGNRLNPQDDDGHGTSRHGTVVHGTTASTDDDSSMSSRRDNFVTSFDRTLLPKIVSPPESPILSSSVAKMPFSRQGFPEYPFDLIDEIGDCLRTGDEVFFEGQSFRYLDHLDLDDVVNDITVANVEYV